MIKEAKISSECSIYAICTRQLRRHYNTIKPDMALKQKRSYQKRQERLRRKHSEI